MDGIEKNPHPEARTTGLDPMGASKDAFSLSSHRHRTSAAEPPRFRATAAGAAVQHAAEPAAGRRSGLIGSGSDAGRTGAVTTGARCDGSGVLRPEHHRPVRRPALGA